MIHGIPADTINAAANALTAAAILYAARSLKSAVHDLTRNIVHRPFNSSSAPSQHESN